MIEYTIRTWRCSVCDYAQDFEPVSDLYLKHLEMDLGDGLCPNGCGKKMFRVTDPDRKCCHRHIETSDIEKSVSQMRSEGVEDHEILRFRQTCVAPPKKLITQLRNEHECKE